MILPVENRPIARLPAICASTTVLLLAIAIAPPANLARKLTPSAGRLDWSRMLVSEPAWARNTPPVEEINTSPPAIAVTNADWLGDGRDGRFEMCGVVF